MPRYAIAIDVEKCTGCHSCFLACKDEFAGNDFLPTSKAQAADGQQWLRIEEIEHGAGTKVKVDYLPVMCQHCEGEDAPCILPNNQGAVYRRDDGIVIIDPEKARGRRDIVDSCPYGVVSWNQESDLPQKCTLCAHLLDAGEKTVRCVECCPTGALVFGDLDDPHSEVSRLLAAALGRVESLRPELGTKPTTKYLGIPKPFIAGEVLLADRSGECVQGAKVTLEAKDSGKTIETTTDFLGDFEFKNLARDKEYVVKAEFPGYFPQEIVVRTSGSQNLGEVVLVAK